MSAAMVEALTTLACASRANCFFQVSKPAAMLPHCAALALPDIHTSATKTPMVSSLNCLPTLRTVRDAMVPAIDSRCSVYVRNAAGDWTFNMEALRRLSPARWHPLPRVVFLQAP
jgi:hypothetical protein